MDTNIIFSSALLNFIDPTFHNLYKNKLIYDTAVSG